MVGSHYLLFWLVAKQKRLRPKRNGDDCCMHPNDQCEEVLKLVKIIRLMEDESELGFMDSTWDKIEEIIK